jgi:hypothetical protein
MTVASLIFTTRHGRETVEHDPVPVPDGPLPYVCRRAVVIGRFTRALPNGETLADWREASRAE